MSGIPDENAQPAKPGTACLGCRRRKLKCSREQEGCNNCLKADLPCVYPTPETGAKRKRGPYKKDKAPRERHLEDLVKYLEPKGEDVGTTSNTSYGREQSIGTASNATYSFRPAATDEANHSAGQAAGSRQPATSQSNSGNAEDLVKDALIALTKSSGHDNEHNTDRGKAAVEGSRRTVSLDAGLPGSHPSARRMFEYWDLFVHRVDPVMKVIHCPSFTKNLFAAVDDPKTIGAHIETLLFSIYFSAVSTCTSKECHDRFGESRSTLLQRYSKTIEANLSDNYSMPALESLQALVLYLIAIRRDDGDTSVRALFSLAVRMAQLINLHEDPADRYSPFEAEMRRRLWWQLCGLESRAAEEGVARQTSIMEERNVRVASNLNDGDLQLEMKEAPAPRTGVAGTSFLVLRSEIISLAHRLWAIKKRFKLDGRANETALMQEEQRSALQAFRSRMRTNLLEYCDISRRYDWLMVMFYEAMSVKMHMIVEHPTSQIPTKEMSKEARLDLLQSSVMVIGSTLGISKSEKLGDWGWYFRGYMQWHAVAVVIAELGRSTNPSFANNAWAVLDPILRSWDETYKQKRDEPAWDHVNTLIEKARQMKRKAPAAKAGQPAAAALFAPDSQSSGQQTGVAISPTPAYQLLRPAQPMPHPNLAPTTISWFPNFNNALHTMQDSQQLPTAPDTGLFPSSGCTQHMPGFQITNSTFDLDMGNFDSLENIDFSAFDAVFGDTSWDSSPSMDFTWDAGGLELGMT